MPVCHRLCIFRRSFLLLIVAGLATAEDDGDPYPWLDCPSRTTPSPSPALPASKNDTFRANLLALLGALPAAVAPTGFASTSRGAGGDRAFVRGLCAPDLTPSDCVRCLDTGVKNITGCNSSRRAGVWNPRCFLSYADTNASTADEESYSKVFIYNTKVPDQDGYEKTYYALMSTLPGRAAYSSERMFAAGEARYAPPPNGTMYGLVQCMRDRGAADCERCLQKSVKQLPDCCWGYTGGLVLSYNCFVRFGNESFFDPALAGPPPAAPAPSVPAAYGGERRGGNKRTRAILAVALALGIALAVALALVGIFLKRRTRDRGARAPAQPDEEKRRHLDWRKRYLIICGVARGLLYLHEESRLKIIHRDLKPSNILLDEDMNPKISDFGLSRAFWGDQSRDVTKRPAGTLGYMAPEYAYCGHVSAKTDIFSFGVIILEMVTGRRNNNAPKEANFKNVLSYVWEKWRTGSVAEIVDASLGGQYSQIEMLNCIQIGLLCVQKKPRLRPDASTVVLTLESYSTSLQAPSRPAFFTGTSDAAWEGASGSTSVSTRSSINDHLSAAVSENDVTITELQPR